EDDGLVVVQADVRARGDRGAVHGQPAGRVEALAPDVEEIAVRVDPRLLRRLRFDVDQPGRVMRVQDLHARQRDPDVPGDRDRVPAGTDRELGVPVVRAPGAADTGKGRAACGEVGDEIVSADPNEDEDDDDADEPTTESERLRRPPGGDPTRLRLQFLNQLRGV